METMLTTYKHKGLSWVDLESPTAEEVKKIMQKYDISPVVADELLRPTIRPRVDIHNNFIYLILHFPFFDLSRKMSIAGEIDFIIGKNFLITAHYRSIAPLYELAKMFEVGMLVNENRLTKNPGQLMFFILRHLYDFTLRQLDHIHLKISAIEENIFMGKEKEMVREISYAQGDILEFKRAIHAHKVVLNSLKFAGEKFFNSDFTHYAKSMIIELEQVENLVQNSKETIKLLQETNNSLLSNRTNEIMKTLTVLAFVTFPLVFLSQLFGMNVENMPLTSVRGGFWILILIMIFPTIGVLAFFKRKKWL
ncbi:MAG: magnesium transporter CorA family protein [Patescibacteria group bacterium]